MNKRSLSSSLSIVAMVLVGHSVCTAASHAVTLGALVAVPNVVAVNTPTTVLVTVTIVNPSVIAASVNLLRVDSSDRVRSELGVLHDDGANGDAVRGDKTYSARVTLAEPSTGSFRLQASAVFRGQRVRVTSAIQTMFVQADLSAERTITAVADQLTTGNIDLALTKFPPSDVDRQGVMSLDAGGLQKLAWSLKNARLVSATATLRIYVMPFQEEDGSTSFNELSLSKTDQNDWVIVTW